MIVSPCVNLVCVNSPMQAGSRWLARAGCPVTGNVVPRSEWAEPFRVGMKPATGIHQPPSRWNWYFPVFSSAHPLTSQSAAPGSPLPASLS